MGGCGLQTCLIWGGDGIPAHVPGVAECMGPHSGCEDSTPPLKGILWFRIPLQKYSGGLSNLDNNNFYQHDSVTHSLNYNFLQSGVLATKNTKTSKTLSLVDIRSLRRDGYLPLQLKD